MRVNFKLSLIILLYLFDMADKLRKKATFRNTVYESKLSKVIKPIEKWVKKEKKKKNKKKEKCFYSNDIAQRSEK